jgi:hypothetical protein
MGWCSGTEVFDPVVNKVLQQDIGDANKTAIIIALIKALQDMDWDCESDSDYWDHALVRKAFKKVCPDWDWEDIEG